MYPEVEKLQCRLLHGEEVGNRYPSRLENAIFMWDIYVPLVMKGLRPPSPSHSACQRGPRRSRQFPVFLYHEIIYSHRFWIIRMVI
jgi:hypothetical protein